LEGRWLAQRDGGVTPLAALRSILKAEYPSDSSLSCHLPLKGRIVA
jgi:hypothetical protein